MSSRSRDNTANQSKIAMSSHVIIFQSSLSPACSKLEKYLSEQNFAYRKVLLDTERDRQKVTRNNPNLKITSVPTMLVIYPDGDFAKYEGIQDIVDYIQTGTEIHVPPNKIAKHTPQPQQINDAPRIILENGDKPTQTTVEMAGMCEGDQCSFPPVPTQQPQQLHFNSETDGGGLLSPSQQPTQQQPQPNDTMMSTRTISLSSNTGGSGGYNVVQGGLNYSAFRGDAKKMAEIANLQAQEFHRKYGIERSVPPPS